MSNRYGVDTDYFLKWINRMGDLSRHKPDELAREFARLAKVADANVLLEPEFTPTSAEHDKAVIESFRDYVRERVGGNMLDIGLNGFTNTTPFEITLNDFDEYANTLLANDKDE